MIILFFYCIITLLTAAIYLIKFSASPISCKNSKHTFIGVEACHGASSGLFLLPVVTGVRLYTLATQDKFQISHLARLCALAGITHL